VNKKDITIILISVLMITCGLVARSETQIGLAAIPYRESSNTMHKDNGIGWDMNVNFSPGVGICLKPPMKEEIKATQTPYIYYRYPFNDKIYGLGRVGYIIPYGGMYLYSAIGYEINEIYSVEVFYDCADIETRNGIANFDNGTYYMAGVRINYLLTY
jgi:hypothetical protein